MRPNHFTEGPATQADVDAMLDELLALWHRFSQGYNLAQGYGASSPMFHDTRSSWSPYDRDNGVPDMESDRSRARAVGIALFRVPNEPHHWRTVLMMDARNLNAEVKVWTSPRLPKGEELEVLRLEARTKLLVELQREGCIGV